MKKGKKRRGLLLPVLILAAAALMGVALGKYIKTEKYTGQLQFQASLAQEFLLLEHKAVRQPDGSYTLSDSETVPENQYTLIPGLDIPKDPYVVITNKTEVAAYLYVEAVDNTANDAIGYRMSDDWLLLEGVTGKKGGTVYVYTDGGTEPVALTRNEGTETYALLQYGQITVGQKLLAGEDGNSLEFYASMGEVSAVTAGTPLENAKAIYQTHITNAH